MPDTAWTDVWEDSPSGSPADVLSARLEKASDAYAVAADNEALAENAYLLLFQTAWAKACVNEIPVTIRAKWADNAGEEIVIAKAAWNLARAREKAARVKFEETKTRLMRAMGHERNVAAQT